MRRRNDSRILLNLLTPRGFNEIVNYGIESVGALDWLNRFKLFKMIGPRTKRKLILEWLEKKR